MYPATLTNSLMSFSTFLVASLRVSMYSIMPSANSEYFTVSFQFGFLLFFSLIMWVGLQKLCWIIVTWVTSILFLFLFLDEMFSVFHHWEWCLLWFCYLWPLLCWDQFPLCPLPESFCHKLVLSFVKSFFLYLFRWS